MIGHWMDRALCVGRDPEIWFTEKTGVAARKAVARAAAICAQCPVRRECRQHADQLHATDGVWGGWPVKRSARTTIPFSARKEAAR
ncbi:WhiB family transcription factor [Mycobacterium phage IdentityCrisis]|uniref:WhiB family transcription factor n=1 Tax=Mycobacterium phage IdentityCrisis TaxID=2599866 RepID=A0A5J6TGP8_9CAUD|nr:WhiB family transcription factor [Mycobacterium phage IdentityCrisis]QFG10061.1 WhiB family transcription factor [Mycobacterium phage IdentityCrisis]